MAYSRQPLSSLFFRPKSRELMSSLDEQVDDRKTRKNNDEDNRGDKGEALKAPTALIKATTHVATTKEAGGFSAALLKENKADNEDRNHYLGY